MKIGAGKYFRIAIQIVSVISTLAVFSACGLFMNNMDDFGELYSAVITVKNWKVSPTSDIIPDKVYNGNRNIVIQASTAEDFIIDLELVNGRRMPVIAEAELVQGKAPGSLSCEIISPTWVQIVFHHPDTAINSTLRLHFYSPDKAREYCVFELPTIHVITPVSRGSQSYAGADGSG